MSGSSHLFSQTHTDSGTRGETALNNLTGTPRQPPLHYSSEPGRKTSLFLSFSITVETQSKIFKRSLICRGELMLRKVRYHGLLQKGHQKCSLPRFWREIKQIHVDYYSVGFFPNSEI